MPLYNPPPAGGAGSTPIATTVLTGTLKADNNSAGDPIALTPAGHGAAADPHPQYALDTDLASKVATTRAITTTAPLNGGGDLSADRALGILDFAPSGATHARGAVPDPGAVAGTTKFLREDATWAAAGGGAFGAATISLVGADQNNSTVTPAAVTDLSTVVAPGTYLVKYWIVYRTAATTTGIQMFLKHSGTTTRLAATWYTLTTGTTASSGVADQATTTTAQVMEGKGQRASNVANGSTQGVDTAAADQFAVMEGLMIVTVSGTLDFMFNTEVAGSAATIMTGTTLELHKVA